MHPPALDELTPLGRVEPLERRQAVAAGLLLLRDLLLLHHAPGNAAHAESQLAVHPPHAHSVHAPHAHLVAHVHAAHAHPSHAHGHAAPERAAGRHHLVLLPLLAPSSSPSALGSTPMALLEVLHLPLQSPGRLLLVVHDEAVGQIEEVPGVPVHDARHLLGPQRDDGAAALPLAPMLPPSPERRESQLYRVLVGVGTEPRAQYRLDEGVGQAGPGEGLVGELPPGGPRGVRGGGGPRSAAAGVGIAPVVAAAGLLLLPLGGEAGVVADGVAQRIELGK